MTPIRLRRLLLVALTLCLAFSRQSVDADTAADGSVFLKGTYLEAGIHHSAGSFGAAAVAPASFVSRGRQLALVADYGRDGWTTGVPAYSGDYTIPGTPVEGWSLQFVGASGTTVRRTNSGLMGHVGIPGTVTETSDGGTQSAVWQGTLALPDGTQLRVTKTMSFGVDDLHIVVKSEIDNVGTTSVDNLQFMRNIDPDQEQPWTANFATRNYAVEDGDRKMVVARANSYSNLVLGLGTVDPRAAVAFYGFENMDPDTVWTEAEKNPLYTEANPHYADEALNLAFRLGSLAPGQKVTFDYVFAFDRSEFDTVLDQLTPQLAIVYPTDAIGGETMVRVRATDPSKVAKVDVYIAGQFIGSDASASGDLFDVPFDATGWPDGPVTIEAIATLDDGTTVTATANAAIDHRTPGFSPIAIAFTSPAPGQVFGASTSYQASVTPLPGSSDIDSVTFYRESSSGTVLLDTVTTPPFTTTFSTNGLSAGEIVSIKAVAAGGGYEGRAYVSGRVTGPVLGSTFLKGDFIEAGIDRAGSFGTSQPAPSGYVYRGKQLGFIADYGRDGWTTGLPQYAGDYFVPGTPVEGWTVEWEDRGGTERTFSNAGLMNRAGVTPSRITNTSTEDEQSVVWEGLASNPSGEQLKVVKTVRFRRNGLYMAVHTVLTNVGWRPLYSVDFMRNVDPDQEQPWTGDFATRNYAVVDGDRKLAVAVGRHYPALAIGLGTIDARAMVTHGGFDNQDPDWVWDQAAQNSLYSAEHPHEADEAIAVAFKLGTLSPGQSASFDYAYILNADDLDEALADLVRVTIVQPTSTVSGAAVPFQATTDDPDGTTTVKFYVNGTLVGEDTSHTGGLFKTTFDSRAYANGSVELKVVATFASGRVAVRTATIDVDNPGPPVAFVAPAPGGTFLAGTPLTATVNSLDNDHPAARVRFFRDSASAGSVLLGEDTAAPFSVPFAVDGLPEGDAVTIRAVAFDALERSTTISVSGTVTIVRPQTITFAALPARTYGDPDITLAAEASSGLPVSFSVAGNCSIAGAVVRITGAGSCTVMASQVGNANYEPAPNVTHTFAIAPAALTVTAANATRVYGEPNPVFTASYAGFVRGDTAAVFTGAPALTTAAVAGSGVGTYAITAAQGTLAAANYTFTFAPGTLTITPRVVMVTVAPLTKVYGDPDPQLTYTIADGALAGEDAFTGALSRDAGEGVGVYAITQGTLALNANYAFTFTQSTLTITARPLTVAAQPAAKVYGQPDPALTYILTAGSLAAGDSLTGQVARQPGENAGTYAIGQGTLTAGVNYALTVVPAAFTIDKATPTVAIAGGTFPFDEAPHGAVCTVTGPLGALAGIITYQPGPGVPTSIGTYTATCSFGGDANHFPAFASATIVISLPICQVDDRAGALVRRGITFNGGSVVDGSVQVLTAANVTFNGAATVRGDLIMAGTPSVRVNGHPTYGGTIDAAGSASPSGHRVTINGGASLGRIVRKARVKTLPVVEPPPAPAGTRSVSLNRPTDYAGDFATLRNLTLNGNAGAVAVPAGAYGSFAANGNSSLVLGVAGATTPAIYSFDSLQLNGKSRLQVIGPVIVTLRNGVTLNGNAGSEEHPDWLTLRVANGGVALNGSVSLAAIVEAPNGAVVINSGTRLTGRLAADTLTLNGNARLVLIPEETCQQ